MARRTWSKPPPDDDDDPSPPSPEPPQAVRRSAPDISTAPILRLFTAYPFRCVLLQRSGGAWLRSCCCGARAPLGDLAFEHLRQADHGDAEQHEDEEHPERAGGVERLGRQRDDVADAVRGGEQLTDEQPDEPARDP